MILCLSSHPLECLRNLKYFIEISFVGKVTDHFKRKVLHANNYNLPLHSDLVVEDGFLLGVFDNVLRRVNKDLISFIRQDRNLEPSQQ